MDGELQTRVYSTDSLRGNFSQLSCQSGNTSAQSGHQLLSESATASPQQEQQQHNENGECEALQVPTKNASPKRRIGGEGLQRFGSGLDKRGLEKILRDSFCGGQENVHKHRSADDFMQKSRPAAVKTDDLAFGSEGEGHCGGACALIPPDLKPLVQQAYHDESFEEPNSEDVLLPMVDEAGIIRREVKAEEEVVGDGAQLKLKPKSRFRMAIKRITSIRLLTRKCSRKTE